MTFRLISYKHVAAAMLAGLALRLFFIAHRPFPAGDTKFYEELARNWLDHGVYGLFVRGQLLPVDMRMPGYPAFLAAIYTVLGRSRTAVMIVQAGLDLITCALIAGIAARLAPASRRSLVATAALWMAVLCPFTAGYTAALLTETLAAFMTTLTVYVLLRAFADPSSSPGHDSLNSKMLLPFAGWFFLAGVIAGIGTLVRPESPLLLAAAGFVLCVRWRHRIDWPKLVLAGSWMAAGLLLALLPWAARNARTLGRVQFLAPRYAESRGDFIPRGFYSWTRTWMVRPRDAYLVPWKLGKEPIRAELLPRSAFDSQEERARVESLMHSYNTDLQMTPMLDHEFADVARARTSRAPLRTYLTIPIERAFAMWFTPRVELLPYSGDLWPPGEKWRSNRWDFGVTLAYGFLNFALVGLAIAGAWRSRASPGVALLIAFLILRTALLTRLQTVEPRYTVVCLPLILTLAALAWAIPARATSPAGESALELHDVVS
ncbi:MAG: hypothetical protein WB780_22195 [Candidatus Acidiferrales bacterium]